MFNFFNQNMKCVILAGGYGTRISEETQSIPKPMITIGVKPILWHIMKLYDYYGIKEFIICTGYQEYAIKEYFMNYFMHNCDVTFDFSNNSYITHKEKSEQWKVSVVNTGLNSMTGHRIKQIYEYVKDDDFFCLTYGDGVANVDIGGLINFHKNHGKLATLTSVSMATRFGMLDVNSQTNLVSSFVEKPLHENNLINAGFFCLSPKVIKDYINNDVACIFEQDPLKNLSKDGELCAYRHSGFWKCMDTLREKQELEKIWSSGSAPWKVW